MLFCLFLIIHVQEGRFLPLIFSSCTAARATYSCAHAWCVCLYCNCAEMQESLFVCLCRYPHVCPSIPVQKMKTLRPRSVALEAAVFSRSKSKGGRKRNNELQRFEPMGSLKFRRRQQQLGGGGGDPAPRSNRFK